MAANDIPDVATNSLAPRLHRYVDVFRKRLGEVYFAKLHLVDRANELRCERPLNLVCSKSWTNVQHVTNADMARSIANHVDIDMFAHTWRNDSILVQRVEANRASVLSDSLLAKKRARYGIMVPNVGNDIFEFDRNVWNGFQASAREISSTISALKRHAQPTSVDGSEARFQDSLVSSYDEMQEKGWLPALGGFGISGLQLYLKDQLAYTPLHSEIGCCEATNFMLHNSGGLAFWIGVHLSQLEQFYSKQELAGFSTYEKDGNLVFQRIREWLDKGVDVWLAIQAPGYAVHSGTFNCPAHLVLTLGQRVTQIAWNHGISARGMTSCLDFWKGHEETTANNGTSTRKILPCLRLQRHMDIGLGNELKAVLQRRAEEAKKYPSMRFRLCAGHDRLFCHLCEDLIDLIEVSTDEDPTSHTCFECYCAQQDSMPPLHVAKRARLL
eukprot:GILK01010385.1.p1 GENE.GILK01010385.1~~GILK01010385.1.p1  ORF type:complete len:511 (-),score=56.15 GILK01010385.1:688-2010(-)